MKLRTEFIVVLIGVIAVFLMAWIELSPIAAMMDGRARVNSSGAHSTSSSEYQYYHYAGEGTPAISIDFLAGKHFWNPQLAIWIEDSTGHHLQTLMVTTSTAKGLFYAGRTLYNFKQSDEAKSLENTSIRRVDALPYWSHKRGVRYPDGLFAPHPDQPLPDAITGATPVGNFRMSGSPDLNEISSFRLLIEVNVAFDENEYFSEYDYPDDPVYHGGTGLLGQPSIVYAADFQRTDTTHYQLMSIIGRGHHSGRSGELFTDLEKLTTSKSIAGRIVAGVNEEWFHKK